MIKSIKKNGHFSWILVFFIFIGLLAGMYLTHERYKVEAAQNRIENVVNYDAVLRAAFFEKKTIDQTFKDLKDAGVTAMAIYDRTLQKMNDAGEITVLRAADLSGVYFYDTRNYQTKPGATYIFPVNGKYDQFKEVADDLVLRLGPDKVNIRQTNRGTSIELLQPYEALVDMNLSLSRVQAQEVIARGFNVIARPTNIKNETKGDVAHVLNRLEGLPNITGIIFVGKDVLGYPNDVDYTVHRLQSMRIPVIGIESTSQLQYERQDGFMQMASALNYSTGRVFTISDDYLKKLEPEETTQQFYISDMERNIRINLLPIYEKGVGGQTALGTSISYIKDLKEKLASRGYEFGRPSIYPSYYPSTIPLIVTFIGIIALFVFTFNLLIPISEYYRILSFLVLLFATIVIYALTSGTLLRQILALSAAITAPVASLTLCMDCWKARKLPSNGSGFVKTIGEGAVYTAAAVVMASIGGFYIAAILGSTNFFMEFAIFRGVKLTFVMPVVLIVIAYLERFPLWKGRTVTSLADVKAISKDFLTADVKVYTVVIFVVIAVAGLIFVGRSGHTAGVPVPAIELELRRFLENTLFARPREKEFMIGYPALMFAVYALKNRWPLAIHFIFTVTAVIGLGSMVETFAHIRTPVIMSIMRGFDGMWLGIVLGIIGIVLFRVVIAVLHWLKKQREDDTYE